ncbi:AraC family transcriptional regulator [Chryseolinea sp. T2]|uniref:helix-turn-helix domain-containing protein n=1 Tax=Chryseolinea sp. T2 TaxID=3129255 RepID=UPI003077AF90
MTAVNFYEDIVNNPAHYRQLTCKDLLFAYYNCPQVDLKKEFYSQHNFISYTFSGAKRIHKGDKSWYLNSDIAIFGRKGAYLFEKFENVEHCVMAFFIPDSYLKSVISENRSQLPVTRQPLQEIDPIVKLDVTPSTRAFFQSMIAYFQDPPSESILELKFRELLLNVMYNPRNQDVLAMANNIQLHERPSIPDVMEDNFLYNLAMEDFAKIALRSLPTFKREFKTIYNTTPGKWLLNKRLENAIMLLNSTSKSVNEIAFESGFENNSHFSRVFKEKYGKSPLHFRKEIPAMHLPIA